MGGAVVSEPAFHDDWVSIYHGDAWELAGMLEQQSVHTIVTSPPYWGLRDYGEHGQFGLEATLEEYVEWLVLLFALLRPALRDDGTVWLNLGDSFAGSGGVTNGLKPKDLVGMPWRVAFALQADGWYLRSDIIWHKPNPMPESVTDRPTKSHEYIFLLSKQDHYYYDAEAIKEDAVCAGRILDYTGDQKNNKTDAVMQATRPKDRLIEVGGKRNKRDVWTVSTKPFSQAHFAVFPPDLIEPCILAGAPEKCCPECGAPWERIVERVAGQARECPKTRASHKARGGTGVPVGTVGKAGSSRINPVTKTLGFTPTCDHGHEPIGGTVLDPFMGSGTTAQVARSLGRKAIGFELNAEYIDIAAKHRLAQGVLL